MEDDSWELGRKVRYYNGSLQKLRLERGLSLKEASKLIGISLLTLCQAETMRRVPNPETMEKIEKFYGVSRNKLFPVEFLKLMKNRDKEEIEYAKTEINALEAYATKQTLFLEESTSPDTMAMGAELRDKLSEAMWYLTEREQKILTLRYGLDGNKPMSIRDAGAYFGITRSRIAQIEHKALCKLRKNKELKDFGNDFFHKEKEEEEKTEEERPFIERYPI